MTNTPEDWVLIEGAKRFGYTEKTTVEYLRAYYQTNDPPGFRALCDMIAKHEQPPVDRKLLCAREACAEEYKAMADGYRMLGVYDDQSSTKLAIRAIELWEEGFGK
jgi:hypothetical protein